MFAPDMSWEHFEWLERAIGIPCFTGDNLGNYSCSLRGMKADDTVLVTQLDWLRRSILDSSV